MFKIVENEGAAIARDPDLMRGENAAIVIAQNRNGYLVAELFFRALPIDIEVGGITAGGAVFEQIPPPAVQAGPIAMWFGTISRICPKPYSRSLAVSRSCAAAPPNSWFTTR